MARSRDEIYAAALALLRRVVDACTRGDNPGAWMAIANDARALLAEADAAAKTPPFEAEGNPVLRNYWREARAAAGDLVVALDDLIEHDEKAQRQAQPPSPPPPEPTTVTTATPPPGTPVTIDVSQQPPPESVSIVSSWPVEPQAEPAPEDEDDPRICQTCGGAAHPSYGCPWALGKRLAALEQAQVRTGKSVTELWRWRDSHGKVQCDIDNAIFKRLDALEARLAGQGEVPRDVKFSAENLVWWMADAAHALNFLLAEARQRRAT